jgi:hypothetical protein
METSRRTDGNHPPSAGFTGVGSDLHGRIVAALRLSGNSFAASRVG